MKRTRNRRAPCLCPFLARLLSVRNSDTRLEAGLSGDCLHECGNRSAFLTATQGKQALFFGDRALSGTCRTVRSQMPMQRVLELGGSGFRGGLLGGLRSGRSVS